MPISRFDKPAFPKYTSQFVEERYPFEAIQQAGQTMQGRIDKVRGAAGILKNKLSIDVDPDIPDKDIYITAKQKEQQYGQAVDELISDFQKTGDINKTARGIQEISQQWQQDPFKSRAEFINKKWR